MKFEKEKREYEEELRVKKDKEQISSTIAIWIIAIIVWFVFIALAKFL